MIITCNNCKKSFTVDANLIPEKGRLLQCNVCNYKWFFKNDTVQNIKKSPKADNLESSKNRNIPKNKTLDTIIVKENKIERNEEIPLVESNDKKIHDKNPILKKKEITVKDDKNIKKNNFSILNPILIFIISFTAFIILIDTLKRPISKIFPNIEFLLYSLYESIKDIFLFIKDLI
jgi:predicted Zn finger-like uncharacterized protein